MLKQNRNYQSMKLASLKYINLSRIWRGIRSLKGFPIVEFDISQVFDRMASRIISHELLKLFDMEEEKRVEYYINYNKWMHEIQNKHWLYPFLNKEKDIHYWITPWGGCNKKYSERHLTVPYSKEYVNNIFLIRSAIKKNGYHPEKYGYITGQMLVDDKKERRVIIWNGHKRALSLANLGYKRIKVEISGGDRWNGEIQNHIVKSDELNEWKNVRNNLYSKEEARNFFENFFEN